MLVKQPVVVRDPDHGIPPSSGIWSTTTRVHASPVSFVRRKTKEGLSARTIPRSMGGSRFIATSASVLRDLHVIQFCDSPRVYDIIVHMRRST